MELTAFLPVDPFLQRYHIATQQIRLLQVPHVTRGQIQPHVVVYTMKRFLDYRVPRFPDRCVPLALGHDCKAVIH